MLFRVKNLPAGRQAARPTDLKAQAQAISLPAGGRLKGASAKTATKLSQPLAHGHLVAFNVLTWYLSCPVSLHHHTAAVGPLPVGYGHYVQTGAHIENVHAGPPLLTSKGLLLHQLTGTVVEP
jgi:hypothetical protein